MSSRVTSFLTAESLFDEIETCRNLQCQRRLFHMYHDENKQTPTLLDLQQATTKLYEQLIKNLNIEEDLTFHSRPFGLCSHAQYFPEYVAKAIIYEIEQIPQINDHVIQPNIVTDFICRYHTRIAGIEPKLHTRHFILQQLQSVYEDKKNRINITSIGIYEEILAKIISQIDFFVDHPFLSMMYHDNLFLGICNSTIDKEMNGTRDELQILLRFNSLAEHQSTQSASVRYIVHNGQLTRASFHTKAFVDEMCRMICESNSEKAKTCRLISDILNRSFHDFSLYFDNELFRLSTVAPPTKEGYKPLIPVLWSTMRPTNDERSKQLPSSPLSNVELATSNNSSISPIQSKIDTILIVYFQIHTFDAQLIYQI
ncbi:unnamed protein product [Rotaria sordida]|uniref:Uncharacterized protein n=1 Tax=Rotaria sordida TaxID=392033 RepID=A0A818GEV5_9BILA|nr:unnamed protein product [Rotaria sordida]CAF3545334.1 unnamed protein product [Rotaria sordida]CAF3842711.1 unnamed protein product [Rotaria sordida]